MISRDRVVLTFIFLFNDIHCGFDSSPDITLLGKLKTQFLFYHGKGQIPKG